LDRAEDEGRTHLVLIDVSEVAEDHLVATLGLREHPAEVPEHPARDVDRGFLPDDLRGAPLQAIHGRILAVLVVADLGVGHRAAHRRRRERERVAPKLDDPSCAHLPKASNSLPIAATTNGDTTIAGRKSATFTSRIARSLRPTPMISKPPTALISRSCRSVRSPTNNEAPSARPP